MTNTNNSQYKFEIVRDGADHIRFGMYETIEKARKASPGEGWVIREIQ